MGDNNSLGDVSEADWATRITQTETVEQLDRVHSSLEAQAQRGSVAGQPISQTLLALIAAQRGRLEERRRTDEERRRTDEERRRADEVRRRADEERRRADEERRRADEERRRADVIEALLDGTYYLRIDQVFVRSTHPAMTKEATKQLYFSCCRPRETRTGSGIAIRYASQMDDPYGKTLNAALEQGNVPANSDSQKRSSSLSQHKTSIWKETALGYETDSADHIAHLVPASVQDANSYWFVTEFLFGINANANEKRNWNQIQQLLHGSQQQSKRGRKRPRPRRIARTGIKHMTSNTIILASQRDFLDYAPCVLIVPILTREEAIGWKGNGYSAIMLIDSFQHPTATSSSTSGTGIDNDSGLDIDADDSGKDKYITLKGVARHTRFSDREHSIENIANDTDLQKAKKLLQEYTIAILHAQQTRKPKEVGFEPKGVDLDGNEATAFYPELCTSDPSNPESLRVRKISFQDHGSTEGHPAPDPLLLVTRAVATLQRRHGYEIVAASKELQGDDDDRSERSILAMEEFLAMREARIHHPDPVGLDIVINND